MINNICKQAENRLENRHIKTIGGRKLLLISDQYPGLWMEHVYDSLIYAEMYPDKLYLAKNAIEVFIDNQRDDGHYPYRVFERDGEFFAEFAQIQECVSFLTLAYEVAEKFDDLAFYEKIYVSGKKWVKWLEENRMTLNRGLVEMFVGYDTGHDNSGRLEGLSCKGNYKLPDGSTADAEVLPPKDIVAPVIAVDMNCNFYGNLTALGALASALGNFGEAELWRTKAEDFKQRFIKACFDKDDCFFYDIDRNGNKRKYLSSTVLHLFLEKVLDRNADRELVMRIYEKHLKNPAEFWTPYPFPSMAINDESCKNHADFNCWGYYTQGLIVLRCTRWMDFYGKSDDLNYICEQWLKAWTECFDRVKLGQEIDPVTGKPTKCSEWYSSCMLMYLYSARRLKKISK